MQAPRATRPWSPFRSRQSLLTLLVALLSTQPLLAQSSRPTAIAQPEVTAAVTALRMSRSAAVTRVVFDLTAAPRYRVETLSAPDRIVIDMLSTRLAAAADPARLRIEGTGVTRIRQSAQPDGTLRWVFELQAQATSRSFALPPTAPYGHRLVLDLSLPANPAIVRAPSARPAIDLSVPANPASARATATSAPGPGTTPVYESRPTVTTASVRTPAPSPASVPAVVFAPELTAARAQVAAPPAPTTVPSAAQTSASATTMNTSPSPVLPATLTSAASATPPATTSAAPPATPSATPSAMPATGSPANAIRWPSGPLPPGGPVVFAIDAGHGGQDPGALGAEGVREKDVVLAIARQLANYINAEPGLKAVLTRTDDRFIALRERTRIARSAGAHFFVSVHADAHSNTSARGASIYALSERGATSETAKWLAERENRSDLIGGVSLDDKDHMLAGVLLDLSMTASLTESLELGGAVLGEIGAFAHLHSRRVEQAGFMVLKSPDIPSILIETGYVSNNEEARNLASESYREKVARAIFRGLRTQANKRPPQGTALAARMQQRSIPGAVRSADNDGPAAAPGSETATSTTVSVTEAPAVGAALVRAYIVVRGDTLHSIAERFRVPARVLRRLNELPSNRVHVGQRLRIPRSAGES